jgi:hypothetical protein
MVLLRDLGRHLCRRMMTGVVMLVCVCGKTCSWLIAVMLRMSGMRA